ncbi:hypothetical protein IWW38_001940 [Coemansia aciculifera]|uniref:Uncharacterized protein n=1 Tax=Coemansia aciculifera TaxID=417176 RepID=A0ACC1M614_9FUNG|nr:hypothetical protein IWW38_001940 [Coemansia aciculifera]
MSSGTLLSAEADMMAVFKSTGSLGRICPTPYKQWSVVAHPPFSAGPLRIPSMRPPLECRTFISTAVEQAIAHISAQIKDPDIRQLFSNILPNTLDTAIAWHHAGKTTALDFPYSFVITGDINAQWARDSANQLLPLLPYAATDTNLSALIAGLVNMQAEQIAAYPFANAYKPPLRSGLVPGESDWAKRDIVNPPPDLNLVFEAKFEIDSLAAFFKLSTSYWRQMQNSAELLNVEVWRRAVTASVDLLVQLQAPTFDAEQRLTNATIRFVRTANSGTETSFGGGRGNPIRRTGMVRTLFRPSDDSVIFPFLVPANAMLAVELRSLADMLDSLGDSAVAQTARQLAGEITHGIYEYGTAEHPTFGRVFAYEVDGYGSRLLMDDANVPSLLALPYLGFVNSTDPIYQNTRRLVLSPDNPWYFSNGMAGLLAGVGSPHTGFRRVWPMSVAIQALTSSDRQEIVDSVRMLAASTGGLGLLHESVHVDSENGTDFTRPWFAWCNGVVSELITRVVVEYPGLL